MTKLKEFLNKLDDNKLHLILYASVGAVISFIVSNLIALQEAAAPADWIIISIAGIAVAGTAGAIKERLDYKATWTEFAATLIGGCIPIIVNTIGYLFYICSV